MHHTAAGLKQFEALIEISWVATLAEASVETVPYERTWSSCGARTEQELAARLPEATRPLLRQLEANRAAAEAQAAAWAAAERSLSQRRADAEARAAAASEAARSAAERLQACPDHP